MWDMTLRILAIIGIILLVLLGVLVCLIFLALFCPVVYRAQGKRTPEETKLFAGASWLFGVLRLRFDYPEPGKLTVKILWKTIFDSSVKRPKSGDAEKPEETAGAERKASSKEEASERENAGSGKELPEEKESMQSAAAPASEKEQKPEESGGETRKNAPDLDTRDGGTQEEADAQTKIPSEKKPEESTGAEPETDQKSGIWGKITKLKYTIQKICDKIREIWENLSYYVQLLQEENTVRLLDHVKRRLAKILKSIRPRHIRAEILFGAPSPDTTGYLYGIYCMFSPALGSGVSVTPDFTQALLQGEVDISGHITGAVLIWNALKLLLDRKLHLFVKKLKAGRKRDGR